MKKFIIEKGTNQNLNDHWDYCIKNDVPFVRILPGEDSYSDVEFDTLCMLSFHKIDVSVGEKVTEIYKAYAAFFLLPMDNFKVIGGANNLIFTVFTEHTDFIAEKLFNYLYRFMRENRKGY